MTKATLRPLHAVTLSMVCLSVLVGCAAPSKPAPPPRDSLAGQYEIKGGGSAIPSVKKLSDAFARAHPGVKFNLEDVGSDAGVALVADGSVELGMISRDLRASEVGQVDTQAIGVSATGVVVHAENPVRTLTRAQLRDIFGGRITDWAEVGGEPGRISVFIREPESSTRSTFDAYIFGSKPEYALDAIQTFEKDPMLNAVRGFKASVGMATSNESVLTDPTIHLVAVDGVFPTSDNIKAGSYPIRRPMYLTYRASDLQPAARAFLDFIRGPEGQQLIARL